MAQIVIDATNLIVGRIGTVAAKAALRGDTVRIVNCEKAIITGTKEEVISKYQRKRSMGMPQKGPYFPKLPDMFVKRSIRGMLPYKYTQGKKAYDRIKCYMGVPEEFKNVKLITIEGANVSKMDNNNYGTVGKICKILGAKI